MDTYEPNIPGTQEEQPVEAVSQPPVAETIPAEAAPVVEAEPVVPVAEAEPTQAAPQPPVNPAPQPRSPYANSPYAKSPYAASPYVHQQAYQPQPIPAQQPKKVGSGKKGKAILCAVLALIVLVGCCAATAFAVNSAWNDRYAILQQQLDDLETKLGGGQGNTVIISGETAPTGGYTPAQVYAIWQEAAYSDHTMNNAQREAVRAYMTETAKAVWAEADWKKRLAIRYRICL